MVSPPSIIAVMGLPGSGKSFFAARLASALRAIHISSDAVRLQQITERTYSQEEKLVVYQTMIQQMQQAVAREEAVVLDATFYRESIREMFILAAKKVERRIEFIEITASHTVLEERLQKKRASSEADMSVHLKIKAAYEPLRKTHLVLQSTQNNIDAMLETALAHIRQRDE
jgi:predicted kinase